jgi:hypothetical protein
LTIIKIYYIIITTIAENKKLQILRYKRRIKAMALKDNSLTIFNYVREHDGEDFTA